ncbi:FAD-dependent oxidoreductase [bacterium]|nr:FAD-dependent oxidoreductase [bacterium]
MTNETTPHLVAVIGAGPAGLYTAQFLARKGVQVALFNQDIKPGGLAEYGIFPDKHKLRQGLLKQFDRILAMPEIRYLGNLKIGQHGDLKLDQLRQAGFQAFVVTTGAQHNNWLGLPGEDLAGVYQANDIVFHYNLLPRHADWSPKIGENVGVIGMGNVMLDIVHYLKLETQTETVTAFARRGPTEVKFDKQTLAPVASCLDLPEIRQAVDAAAPQVAAVGKDVEEFYNLLSDAQAKAADCDSGLDFRLQFLHSPRRLLGDENGRVSAVVFECNHLVREGDRVVSRGTGETVTVPMDTVIFSIGSRVDEGFGLPTSHGNYVTTPKPRFPVDEISYEVYNPDLCAECEDIFVSGWARVASEGIVGLARKDAERGARAVLQYLDTLPAGEVPSVDQALTKLPRLQKHIVNLADLERLSEVEEEIAKERGLPVFKFGTEAEMLKVIEGD